MPLYEGSDKPKFAVAPMLDWTDRHCRYFHRLMTKHALLYTEMVVADAVIFGHREKLLVFNEREHPLALQLGGSSPEKLSEAAKIGADFGYDEINLNVGCPSDRVQSGAFGACLMLQPDLVGQIVEKMKRAVSIPVTVKCRIGVDEQDVLPALDNLAHEVWRSGCDALWVHARKAWLQGLSPKENRDIPPLDYQRVYDLKLKNTNHFIGINGGIQTLDEVETHLKHVDGGMVGRSAYQNPAILREVDAKIYHDDRVLPDDSAIIDEMCEYADRYIKDSGGKLSHVTRHMIGLFSGRQGAKKWRQTLSSEANREGAQSSVLRRAYSYIE
ncbi:tRNA dihydrouridine(20/20a) synthase DusA [Bartonella choladocola]|uniref:tRNA-dihydrouridine(20/20a) synthase n=1 Tax=Bartonella choladocola TaxID=2750995 RepID=A0A1U9MI70_9HYPH|nr:tRNA dihydrouridine(20/20a) synthase DusA [Bartonella choladocola]AQT47423.1 tRNA-U16,U17-dihydrouridine synthase [Bartonella choladocola]